MSTNWQSFISTLIHWSLFKFVEEVDARTHQKVALQNPDITKGHKSYTKTFRSIIFSPDQYISLHIAISMQIRGMDFEIRFERLLHFFVFYLFLILQFIVKQLTNYTVTRIHYTTIRYTRLPKKFIFCVNI